MTHIDDPAIPQPASMTADDAVPTVELHDFQDRALRVLRTLQLALLKHPVAAQAAFNALVKEGRAFAQTDGGRALRTKLERSELVHRARLVFDFGTLSMLEEDPSDVMPSAYLDVLFMLGAGDRADDVLHELFRVRSDDRDR